MPQIALTNYVDEVALQIQNGQIDEALAHCRHILSHYPMYLPVYRLLGYASLEQGDYAHATHFFQSMLSADPEDADAWAQLAMLSDDLGELEQAIWLMERAFEIEPGNAETRDRLRHFYSHRDGVERVRIKLTPTALGRLYDASGFHRRAAQEFERTLRSSTLHPLHVAYLEVNLARALVQIPGMAPMADRVCHSLLEKLPKSLVGNLIMGQIRSSAGLDKEAAPYLQVARALDPEGQVAYKTFGNQSPIRRTRVEIPYLEYQAERGPVEQALEAPPSVADTSWLDHVGETLGIDAELGQTAADTTEAPAWLQEWSAKDLESTPVEASAPEWAAATEQEPGEPAVPDWLRDLQQEGNAPAAESEPAVETTDQTAEEEDTLPEWLKTLGAEPGSGDQDAEPSIAEAFPDVEAPPWLQELKEEETTEGTPEEDSLSLATTDVPDWLRELEPEEPSAVPEPGADDVEEQEPGWLQELRSETEVAETEVAEKEAILPLEEEELPDWLQELRPEAEIAETEAMEEEAILPLEEEELPDWLQELRPEAEIAEPEEEEEEEAILPLEEEELPDWLQELRPEAETAEPEEEEEEEATLPLEEEELPDWLQELRSETEAPAVEAPEPEAAEEETIAAAEEEELPDWLQALRTDELATETVQEETTETAGSDEMDDWLQELRAEGKTAAAREQIEPEEKEQLPAWLQELHAEPEATSEPTGDLEIPDWLQELHPESPILPTEEMTLLPEETAAESVTDVPVEPVDESELPEWLRELRPESGIPVSSVLALDVEAAQPEPQEKEPVAETAGPAGAQLPPPVEGMPDWLLALEAEISGQAQPPEFAAGREPHVVAEPQVEAVPAEGEMPAAAEDRPEWLMDLEAEVEGVAPPSAPEADTIVETPAVEEQEPAPDELQPASTPDAGQGEEPEWLETLQAEPADQVTVEEMPEWLEQLRSQQVDVEAVHAAQPEEPEEEIEWLQTLVEVEESPLEPEGAATQPAAQATAQEPELVVSPTQVPTADSAQLLVQARTFLQEGALDAAVEAYAPLAENATLRDQAIDDLEQAAQDHPNHPGLHQALGDAYMRAGQLQKALQAYQRALANL